MMVIDEILRELVEYSTEWNNDEISKDELNIKLELIIKRLDLIEIDFSNAPLSILDSKVQASFNQLLYKSKYRGIHSIKLLIEADKKQSYNAKLRWILGCKCYFKGLYRTIQNNVLAYIERNRLKYVTSDIQIFILGEEKEMLTNE